MVLVISLFMDVVNDGSSCSCTRYSACNKERVMKAKVTETRSNLLQLDASFCEEQADASIIVAPVEMHKESITLSYK